MSAEDLQIQLRNIKAEMLLLKAFCLAKPKVRTYIVSNINTEIFGSQVGKIIWNRVRSLNTKAKLPKKGAWDLVTSDPVISRRKTVVDILQKFNKVKVSGSKKFVKEVIETLEFYQQKRDAFNTLQDVYQGLADAENANEVLEALVPIIAQARTQSNVATGKYMNRLDNLNLGAVLQKKKDEAGANFLARTLWPSFDIINTGFSFGSLITFASTTGGGKSTVIALSLLLSFALQGLKVSNVSLEMTKDQITERIAANVSGIPLHKIRAFNLTQEELVHLENASLMLAKMVASKGGSYWTLTPEDKDVTIHEALTIAYERTPDVILLDYINLLAMPKGKDLKDGLNEIAREAKIFAKTHNCIVILLAQLNNDERTKYAAAIEEHCLVGDSLIDTAKGLICIGDYLPRNNVNKIVAECDLEVATAQGKRKAKRWYKKGEKACIAITTEQKNFNVTGSVTTKVLVLNNDLSMCWKPLCDIVEGDYIAIKRDESCWPKNAKFDNIFNGLTLKGYTTPKKMTPALAKVCGYLVAEGHLKNAVVSFCSGNELVAKNYALYFNALFTTEKKAIWAKQAKAFYVRTESRIISDFFKYIGLEGDSRSKEIPWAVLQSSKKCAKSFLQGYFEGDMNKDCFSACTYSKTLAKQLQVLLLKFGIVAKISDKEDSYDRGDKTKSNRYWRVWIQGGDRAIFKKEIGLNFRELRDTTDVSLKDKVPFITEILNSKKVGKNSYSTENSGTRMLKLKQFLGRNVTYPKIRNMEFLSTLKTFFPRLHKKVALINDTHYYWDTVKTIKHEKHIVYDFTVEQAEHPVLGEGSFVANGVIVHNSDNVIVWSYPANARPGYIKMKQTKARNQVPYDFYLVEDFACMRVFDILDTVGLATLMSRSSTQAYISKTSDYFGMRRFQEINEIIDLDPIGVMKHRFTESINWDDLVTQSVPAPNAPDPLAILEMVREMVYLISVYNPEVAQELIKKLKDDKILSPYSEVISDLDLPLFAKRQLGMVAGENKEDHSEKEKLLALIEQDLLELSQDAYVRADKTVRELRNSDITIPQKEVYDSTYEQINAHDDPEALLRKKKRKKEVVDPETNNSAWMNLNRGYAFHKQLRVDSTPVTVNDMNSPFGSLSETENQVEERIVEGDSEKRFTKYWTELAKDGPPSTDYMKEAILAGNGLPKPSFLLGFDNNYLSKYEQALETVGYHIENRVANLRKNLPLLIAEKATLKPSNIEDYVASIVCKIGEKVIELDKNFPDISELTNAVSNFKFSQEPLDLEPAVQKLSNQMLSLEPTKAMTKDFIFEQCRQSRVSEVIPRSFSDISESPFHSLFKRPQYIESVTDANFNCVDLGFIFLTFKLTAIRKLNQDHDNKQVYLRSMVWALIGKQHRGNYEIIQHIRHCLLTLSNALFSKSL